MELWIRSTARTNLLKARFLTIVEGNRFYKKNEWEYKGFTIANVDCGKYELLGTYKTKERALEVLDEIQELLQPIYKVTSEFKKSEITGNCQWTENQEYIPIQTKVYEMPEE